MIKIDFSFDTPHGKFADALHLPDDHGFTEAEIQAMKEQRRDNWIAIVTAPPVETEPESVPESDPTPEPTPEYIEIDGVRYVKV
jgi:hypothetical protein